MQTMLRLIVISREELIEGSTFITTELQFARLALRFHLGTKKERDRVTSKAEAMCIPEETSGIDTRIRDATVQELF
jgi:hypothetical protein